MNCPRCERESLHEKDRQGITIDVCEECRGIWLDRGELEKLIARAQRELDEARADVGRADAGRAEGGRALAAGAANGPVDDRGPRDGRGRGRWDDDDDFDDDDRRNPRRKRGFLESLGDLFD